MLSKRIVSPLFCYLFIQPVEVYCCITSLLVAVVFHSLEVLVISSNLCSRFLSFILI